MKKSREEEFLGALPATAQQLVKKLGSKKSTVSEALRELLAQKLIYVSTMAKNNGAGRPVAVHSAGQGVMVLPQKPARKRRICADTRDKQRIERRDAGVCRVVGVLESMPDATAAKVGDALGCSSHVAGAILRTAAERGMVVSVRKGNRLVYAPPGDEPREVLDIERAAPLPTPDMLLYGTHWFGADKPLSGNWSRA